MRVRVRTWVLAVVLFTVPATPAFAQGAPPSWMLGYLLEHFEDISLHLGLEGGVTIPFGRLTGGGSGGGGGNSLFDLVLLFSLSHRGLGYDTPGELAGPVAVTNAIGGPAFGSFTLKSFGGGIQRRFAPRGRLSPFARVTAGIQACCGSTAFYVQPGMGGTVPLNDRIDFYSELALRFLRAEGQSAQSWRGVFGVSMPFGPR
jgi:hypothetical protein